MLQVKENELEGIKPEFTLEITKIRKFAEPELNEEFFKTAFPGGEVKDEAGLDKFIDARIEPELRRESDYLFTLQLRDYLVQKAASEDARDRSSNAGCIRSTKANSRWRTSTRTSTSSSKMFTWNYLQKHFIKQDNITVTKDEALAEAKALAAAQFAQYGMPSAPEDMLAGYAEKILADKDQGQKIYEKLYEVKVVEDVKSKIKVTEKAVSADDFAKLAKAL